MDIEKKKKVVLFGAGGFTRKAICRIEDFFSIEAICDNNRSLIGSKWEEKYPVISIEVLNKFYKDYEILISVDGWEKYDEISRQLSNLGLMFRHVNDALYEECIKSNELFFIDENKLRLFEGEHDKNIYVITAPSHSNLGDQAQTYCIEKVLMRNYPEHNILIFDEVSLQNYYESLYMIKQHLESNDIILLHSGYRLTDLYMSTEYAVEMMARLFRDRRMIFLPQTVYYTNSENRKRLSELLSTNVLIMCRDEESYNLAKSYFDKCKVIMYPDFVTSLIGMYKYDFEKKGILLVFRACNDGESMFGLDDEVDLIRRLETLGEIKKTDTTIDVGWEIISKNRKQYIDEEIKKYAQYKIVVTNRLHGVIFSLIANTNVVVLPTKDHKVTAGIKWFLDKKFDGISYCSEISEVYPTIKKILKKDDRVFHSDYFFSNYFDSFDLERIFYNS